MKSRRRRNTKKKRVNKKKFSRKICGGLFNNINNNCKIKFRSDVYEGQCTGLGFLKKQIPNGKGKMTYNTGDPYDFYNNRSNRYNSCVYEGEWVDGVQTGQGTMTYENGDVYEGEWANGIQTGQGTMKHNNGDVYEGEWAESDSPINVNINEGTLYARNVASDYIGVKHGNGTMKYKNGDVYEGEWKSGGKHGNGTMKYKNGDVYEGEWKSGKRNGQGTMKSKNGDVYEGNWINGLPDKISK